MSAIRRIFVSALTCLVALSPAANGQTPPGSPPDQPAVFRVNTELVQTDVMVFDKDGRFVNGLRREDFELRIDGKVKPVELFERVTAGTQNEAWQLTAAQGARSSGRNRPIAPVPDRGRTIFFYVDDLHLDLGGLNATRKLIRDFVENEMSQDDEVAIASASGQIGFLQQLTENKAVLRQALQRIAVRPNSVRDLDRPPITEYQALLIERSDRDVTAFFVRETLRNNPGMTLAQADSLVRSRSRVLLQQADHISAATLSGLESLIRASSTLPGRKLVFFLSGGFVLGNSDLSNHLRRITGVAARTGAVIYAIDARGLVASLLDPSIAAASGVADRLAHLSLGELNATQDGLNALARDTGGRPVFNTNALGTGLSRALQETSVYYLLAWDPDQVTQKPGTFRSIDVKLIGKPDLTVRVRRGFFDVDPALAAVNVKEGKPAATTSDVQIREAISDPYPDVAIPISLSVNYLLGPDRKMMLATSMQIPNEFLSFGVEEGKHTAAVRISGMVVNDRGQGGADFTEVIKVRREAASAPNRSEEPVSATHRMLLGPGLYQVRVAARDERSGRIGSAHAWIEIPDLASRQLALSSLIIGERRPGATNTSGDAPPALAEIRVDRRFQRNADIRFFLFTYNAARTAANSPDLAIQVQLLRANRTVISTALKKLATHDADLDRLPYGADLSLADLPPGRYLLKVIVIDHISRTSASQQARFDIE